jgi:hypothetical protein
MFQSMLAEGYGKRYPFGKSEAKPLAGSSADEGAAQANPFAFVRAGAVVP